MKIKMRDGSIREAGFEEELGKKHSGIRRRIFWPRQ